MFTLSLLVASAQERTVESLRAAGPAVRRWGGYVLVVVGGWLVVLGIFADFFAELFPV